MPPPTTPEKSGGKPRPGGNDDLIPLVIASHPGGFSLNYNRMKELDPQKRTYYALEHKFRKFKARAKEICDAEGGKALEVGKASVEKAGAKSPNNQYEDLIPLLIASIPGRITLNFKRMKELDPHGRTASSLEHKFRKYKAAAKEILDTDGGKATEDGIPSAKITPNPTKKRKTKGEGVKGESDNGEMTTPTKKRRVVKRDQKNANAAGVKEENLDDEANRVNESAEEEQGAKTSDEEVEDEKLDAAMAKKRKPAASRQRPRKKGFAIILKKEQAFVSETESDDEEEEKDSVKTTTQPKPLKKGLARIIKKDATFLNETESEDKEEVEEEEPIKAMSARNGKRKAVGRADKTEANSKKSNGKTTTECLTEDAASELGGAIAGVEVGEASGAPSKESAIKLLFE